MLAAKAHKQANAVRQLQALGATVYYDYQHYYDSGWMINKWEKPHDWIWARKTLGDDLFNSVYLVEFIEHRTFAPPTGTLNTLGSVPTVTTISHAADQYIQLVHSLPNLQELDLSFSRVSDASIDNLGRMHTLTTLRLDDSMVTQEGIERLRRMLPNCDITWRHRVHNEAVNDWIPNE
jgi:hypothetical protein